MTKQGSFKKAVRRPAEAPGQRYTGAREDLDGVDNRIFHKTTADEVVAHLRDHYGIEVSAATKIGMHNRLVFRIDRVDGPPWLARVFAPARPLAKVEGVIVTEFVEGEERDPGFAVYGDPLGRLHVLAPDDVPPDRRPPRAASRPSGVRRRCTWPAEALVHSDFPTHAMVSQTGAVPIHWQGSGRGRLAEAARRALER